MFPFSAPCTFPKLSSRLPIVKGASHASLIVPTFSQQCAGACPAQENEEFYACKWSVNPETGAPLLLLAGKRGLLKALDCSTEELSAVSAGLLC